MRISTMALCVALAGCSDRPIGTNPDIEVTATLSAVTLANDCKSAGERDAPGAGACLQGDPCPGLCQQSNMQLVITASGKGYADIQVLAVRIRDQGSNAMLDEVEAREPQRWSPPVYTTWDERIAAQTSVTASYKLSQPDWSKIETGGTRYASSGRTFRVEVVLLIDGVSRTLQLDGVSREPEVAT